MNDKLIYYQNLAAKTVKEIRTDPLRGSIIFPLPAWLVSGIIITNTPLLLTASKKITIMVRQWKS